MEKKNSIKKESMLSYQAIFLCKPLLTNARLTLTARVTVIVALDRQRSSAIICEQLCDSVGSSEITIAGLAIEPCSILAIGCDRLRKSLQRITKSIHSLF